ncbi:MAG: CPBP family intramembrane metalloprotease [Tenericutes bacterium]|nr:CPBP family intramembrane metalloprotease [Mycoplasmatota bacterium]
MKDKKNLLKIASILGIVMSTNLIIYYILYVKSADKASANIFLQLLNIFFSIVLFNESKKDIEVLKKDESKVIICSIWLFIESIIPGIFGFMFLSSVKPKNNIKLIEDEKPSKKDVFKSMFLILFFMIIMFLLPKFNFFDKIPNIIVYISLFVTILIINFNYYKKDFKVFIKNINTYLPFILKRYAIMLGIMVLVAIPITYLNSGKVSSNQEILNSMFTKTPLLTALLSCIYAPFVEESIFRLNISKIINNKIIFILFSGILFGALHVIDKYTNIYDLLYIFSYSTLGICLAKAYKDTNNIFVSMSMHFIQNTLASIVMTFLFLL